MLTRNRTTDDPLPISARHGGVPATALEGAIGTWYFRPFADVGPHAVVAGDKFGVRESGFGDSTGMLTI